MNDPTMIHQDVEEPLNRLTRQVLDVAFDVHSELGPGLLERVYRICLADVLRGQGLEVEEEVSAPVVFRGRALEAGYRMDLLVERSVVVEVKACEELHPVHASQLYTYLKLTGTSVGLLINFNVRHLRTGIRRVIRSGA